MKVFCPDHLKEVKKFAQSVSREAWESLRDNLRWLSGYADGKAECRLGKDFAPYSFSFGIFRDDKLWLVGGLIFHGPDAPGDGSFPSLSVDLNWCEGDHRPRWSIHT